jgi:hypothetical protein
VQARFGRHEDHGDCAWIPLVPAVPKSPIALVLALYRVWSKLPPSRREQMLDLARKHGPSVAAQARRHGPSVVRAASKVRRPGRG